MEHPENMEIAYIGGALNDMANAYLKHLNRMLIWTEKISQLGYAVFIPGIDLLWAVVDGNKSYDDLFNNSQPFLKASKIMFVVPGYENSHGTQKEIELALRLGIPIYIGQEGLDALIKMKEQREELEREE
jgi:hypothetical protein